VPRDFSHTTSKYQYISQQQEIESCLQLSETENRVCAVERGRRDFWLYCWFLKSRFLHMQKNFFLEYVIYDVTYKFKKGASFLTTVAKSKVLTTSSSSRNKVLLLSFVQFPRTRRNSISLINM